MRRETEAKEVKTAYTLDVKWRGAGGLKRRKTGFQTELERSNLLTRETSHSGRVIVENIGIKM